MYTGQIDLVPSVYTCLYCGEPLVFDPLHEVLVHLDGHAYHRAQWMENKFATEHVATPQASITEVPWG